MIIAKSPYRVTLSGGGSDFESYFSQYGPVISTGFTINKYCYVTLMHLPNINGVNYQIGYSTFERVKEISEINNPGVRGTLECIKHHNKLGINIINELSPRTGIGSSSAMIAALTQVLSAQNICPLNKKELAQTVINIERKHLQEAGGWNDQILTAFGDFISIKYYQDTSFRVKPLPISHDFKKYFINSCVLYYTSEDNIRNSYKIMQSYDNKNSLSYKHKIADLSYDMLAALEAENIEKIASVVDRTWKTKREISNLISNSQIDETYEKILKGGALGGRLMGGGTAGFIFTIYPNPQAKSNAIVNMGIPYVDIGLDEQGTQIVASLDR